MHFALSTLLCTSLTSYVIISDKKQFHANSLISLVVAPLILYSAILFSLLVIFYLNFTLYLFIAKWAIFNSVASGVHF